MRASDMFLGFLLGLIVAMSAVVLHQAWYPNTAQSYVRELSDTLQTCRGSDAQARLALRVQQIRMDSIEAQLAYCLRLVVVK